MTGHVHYLECTLEVPLDTITEYLETNTDYPDPINDVIADRRNSTLLLKSESADESIGNYTPTCQIRATVNEKRIYEKERSSSWNPPDEDRESELVEFACFKGKLDDILQNTALQYQMFDVLCDLAEEAACGDLRAVVREDDTLRTVMYEDGTPRDSKFQIVSCGDHCDDNEDTVNWAENDYIES